jgi:hypothetical protein
MKMAGGIKIQNLSNEERREVSPTIIDMFRAEIGDSKDPEKIVDGLIKMNNYVVNLGDEMPYTIAQEIINFGKLYSKRFDEMTKEIRAKHWKEKDAYILTKYEELKTSIFYELKGLRKLTKEQKWATQGLRDEILSYKGNKAIYYYGGDKEMVAIRSITTLSAEEQKIMGQLLARMLEKGGIIILKTGSGFALPGSQMRPTIGITLLNYTWKIVPKSQINQLYSIYHGGEWFKEFIQ